MIRDFIYLDVPRLQSFASQLLEGLPESETRARSHEADFAGEVKAGLPGLLGASANTKAVLSASSTITSTVHHRLVGLVVDELKQQGYLARTANVGAATDGTFALLSGRLQITDPTALRAIFEDWGALERNINALQAGPEASAQKPTRAVGGRAVRRDSSRASRSPTSMRWSECYAPSQKTRFESECSTETTPWPLRSLNVRSSSRIWAD